MKPLRMCCPTRTVVVGYLTASGLIFLHLSLLRETRPCGVPWTVPFQAVRCWVYQVGNNVTRRIALPPYYQEKVIAQKGAPAIAIHNPCTRIPAPVSSSEPPSSPASSAGVLRLSLSSVLVEVGGAVVEGSSVPVSDSMLVVSAGDSTAL